MPPWLHLLLALLLLPGATLAAAQTSPAVRAAWGFDRSDLAPHPDVRFGVLANGMRYAIMRNAVPAGALSVRLRLGAGSAAEGDNELGAAHLLEHLVFEGTRNIAQRRLPRWLADSGLARWRDFNAFTEYHQTVYRLELARADAAAVETGLRLMREIASELLISRENVQRARAAVIAEIEARNTIADRITGAQHAFFMPGTAIARGPVAGTPDSVRRLRPAALRQLYRDQYVPQQATLIVVGDVDAGAVEAAIAMRFGSWRARPPAAARGGSAIDANRPPEAQLFVDPSAPTSVTIARVTPLAQSADATAPRDSAFLQHLASEMLNRRLARMARSADAPFQTAESAIYDHFATARLARIEAAAKGRDWRGALRTARRELDRALQGFTQDELDEQLAATRASLGRLSAARSNAALADAIVDAVHGGTVFTAPQDGSAAAAYLGRIRLEDVDAAFRAAWAGGGRLTFIAHHQPVPDAELAEALR